MTLVAPDGHWLQFNQAFCELLGYDPDELRGLSEQDLTHRDDLDEGLDYLARALAGEISAYEREKRYVHKLGQAVWVHMNVALVRSEDGSPLHFITQIQDITERKLAQHALELSERRLAEAEERYRTLVEQLPLVTFVRTLDLWQPNIFVSSQVGPMLGYSAEEWETDPDLLATVLHPDDRELVLEKASRVRETGEPFRGEYRYIARDGRVVWVSTRHTSFATSRAPRSTSRGSWSTSPSASSPRPSATGSRPNCNTRTGSRRSAASPAGWPTTSTTC